ncbi:hypothetical protein CCHL11_03350 [Colletotrichum chlorophyti]|uniref:Uncharacterized protein n=1 Tax=Colletotrichum chlorophyti TaxID=708187 RepID=A0A1Q8S3V5_9PEZI|nr:hypothetical protein CCHL11_03350 [Colletotrichum chlorophyti]
MAGSRAVSLTGVTLGRGRLDGPNLALSRNNRAVTLVLTAGYPTNPKQPNITCYRQTSLPLGVPYAEFFKASEALALLQHMVNASSMSSVPFSKRERSDLMLRMRTSTDSMILGDSCSNARAWTSFFSAELGAGRAWEAGTVIFPWKVLERLMSSLNSECARKRRMQVRAAAAPIKREADDHLGLRGQVCQQQSFSQMVGSGSVSLRSENDQEMSSPSMFSSGASSSGVSRDCNSVSSASLSPKTPTELPPPRLKLVSERAGSPLSRGRRQRQNSEPVPRLCLSPPRIALLKSNPCRQNLRRLHTASTPTRLVFYDSIRTWPACSHRARVRLPPCSKFFEIAADQGVDVGNPIVI